MHVSIASLWSVFCTVSGILASISLTLYVLPNIFLAFIASPQNLRQKYGDWAVVTGASSGIGKALAAKLASQGVNVVLVALDDQTLKDTAEQLSTKFPRVSFRLVGADLSCNPEKYMADLRRATDDVPVSIVFSNAGFLKMGFFREISIGAHVANVECNSVAAVRIVHHFYARMVESGIKGCIVITASAAAFMVR